MQRVRVGVAQVRATTDVVGALGAVREFARQAAGDGVTLLVFPEATLGGYPRGASFGTVVGNRSNEGRDEFLAYTARAVSVPGPEIDELAAIAAEYGLHRVVGVIERADSTLYCAARTGLLSADIDLDEVVRGRLDFDAAGQYARPDVFTLMFDDRLKPSVSWMTSSTGEA